MTCCAPASRIYSRTQMRLKHENVNILALDACSARALLGRCLFGAVVTAHKREFADLRVGATVTLRDWRGNSIGGAAFLGRDGEWLARMRSGAVLPILPRELIHVEHGAAEMFANLWAGAPVTIVDWQGGHVRGIAHCHASGIWECKSADGGRWLIEPYRLIAIGEGRL